MLAGGAADIGSACDGNRLTGGFTDVDRVFSGFDLILAGEKRHATRAPTPPGPARKF